MKKIMTLLLASFSFLSLTMAENTRIERSGEGGGSAPAAAPRAHNGGRNNGNHDHQRAVNNTVVHTRIVRQPGHMIPVPEHHAAIVHNNTIVRSIQHDRRVEVVPNHAYWHTASGGVRYVHTYRGGVHWYGFYHGSNFYWTRFHRNRWWWYDPSFNHWVFWANGYWWWSGAGGVLYVYENDSYYPYDEAPIRVAAPAAAEPHVSADTESNGNVWSSGDGKRMIQIQGPQSEAFLYDNSVVPPRYLAYLGAQVDRVRFSGGTDGRALKVLVDFKNGDFSLFSSEGEPLDMTPPDVPSDAAPDGSSPGAPPSPPTDIPN